MSRAHAVAAGALLLACAAASAQQPPRLGAVLQEGPGGALQPLPRGDWRFAKGEYHSVASGLTLRLPQLGSEKLVSVREGVVARFEDGALRVSHVLFVPGPQAARIDRYGPVSAAVVTRLPQGVPAEREAVLQPLEPRTPQERTTAEARGFEFRRIATTLGDGLERVQPNRFVAAGFPHRVNIDQAASRIQSYGVTRTIVTNRQAVLELSQVFPCRQLAAAACKAAAVASAERFTQGVAAFGAAPAAAPAPVK